MDYFSPGLRELSQLITRARAGWELRGARKALEKSETELGLLGWQQAEFDAETQREVDKILQVEREQSRLTNEGATLAQAIAELKAKREAATADFKTKHTPLVDERKTARDTLEKVSGDLAMLRKQVAETESREPQLERELREANRLYSDLLTAELQTPELRDQQSELRERINAIPGQIAEMQRRRARALLEIEELQKIQTQETAREGTLNREVRELESAHQAEDREFADAITAKEREREKLDAESSRLEKQKTTPYREIGRVLADSQLPPMNQPHALEAVRACRVRVQELEYTIAKSRAASDAEDRQMVTNSLILLAAIVLAVTLVLGALIPW